MKKLFWAVMSFALIFLGISALPNLEADAATEYTESYYSYSVSDGQAEITWVDESISGDVTIPATLGGYPVTRIGENAFSHCYNLQSVTIGDSVTTIGEAAFSECNSLSNITISDSVTSIGENAFYSTAYFEDDDNWEKGILYIGNHLIKAKFYNYFGTVFIKEGTITIADAAFDLCDNLTDIYFSESVKSIGKFAFSSCGLKRVNITDGVTSIGDYAFRYCEDLRTITIPDSVKHIGRDVLYATAYSDNYDNWENGILYVDNKLIAANDYNHDADVAIKEGTITIADSSFEDHLTLKSVTIPESVTNIGGRVFNSCSNLESISVDSENKYFESKGNCLIEKSTKTLIYGFNNSVIPDDESVTRIGDYAFDNCSDLESVIIPDSVTYIGNYAFYNCSRLENIVISNSVTDIENYAFYNCSNLKNIAIPDSVINIGSYAFNNCFGIANLVVGNSTVYIGDYAFDNCISLKNITIPISLKFLGDDAFANTGYYDNFYYKGTIEQKNAIEIGVSAGEGWSNATWYYNSCIGKAEHDYANVTDVDCNTCGAVREITFSGWFAEGGKWYYYENGNKVVGAWRKDSIGWVFLGEDGAMITNQWKKDSIGWCYVGANGYIVKNNWVKDGGKWYFLDANGYMVSNSWKKDSHGWVYLGYDGTMVTNQWVKDSLGWCFVGADGYAVTNTWKRDSKGWCYLGASGSQVKNNWVWDGAWYYIDADGYMLSNTSKWIKDKTYSFNASGVCTNP